MKSAVQAPSQVWCVLKRSFHSTWVGVFVHVSSLNSIWGCWSSFWSTSLGFWERNSTGVLPSEAAPGGHSLALISLWPLLKTCLSFMFDHLHAHWVQGSSLHQNLTTIFVLCHFLPMPTWGTWKPFWWQGQLSSLLWFSLYPRQQVDTAVGKFLEFFCP
jgi:hypothetical protein